MQSTTPFPAPTLTELIHELLMERLYPVDPVGAWSQEGRPEVKSTFFLTETASWNDADSSGVQHAQRVKLVGRTTFSHGGLDSLLRQLNGREEVHSTLRVPTRNALHLIERLIQRRSAFLQSLSNTTRLLIIQLKARLPLLRRVYHQLHQTLPHHRSTKRNRDKLINLLHYLRVKADQLKIPTPMSTLAHNALGDGVQGAEFHVVVFTWCIALHVPKDGFEAVEGPDEDVGLVDFVGDDYEFFSSGQSDCRLDVVVGERGTCRVARVDDADCADVGAVLLRFGELRLDGLDVGGPMLGFVEVVGHALGVEKGEGRRVEWVLRDGDEHACRWTGADYVQERVDAGGGAGGEVDAVWVGWVVVAHCRLVSRSGR